MLGIPELAIGAAVIVVAIAAVYFIAIYNNLVRQRNETRNA